MARMHKERLPHIGSFFVRHLKDCNLKVLDDAVYDTSSKRMQFEGLR